MDPHTLEPSELLAGWRLSRRGNLWLDAGDGAVTP
jgi:hypothetical protein